LLFAFYFCFLGKINIKKNHTLLVYLFS